MEQSNTYGNTVSQKLLRLVLRLYPLFLLAIGGYYSNDGLAASGQMHEYRLDNGLKILVKEDHRAPVLISQVWYKVGSSYEHGGITGISHALEHMMFKGTKKYPAGKFSYLIAANGGEENASTSSDYTFYYQELAADKLALSFELEADRMQNLVLNPEEFRKEIQVVMSERNMRTDDNPQALTYERFMATAFTASPYHHPTVGWLSDLQEMTVIDLNRWYKTWYAPNNAIIVVVGDVDPAKVFALAQKYFAAIPASQIPQLKSQSEILNLGEKRLVVKTPAELPWLVMGYLVPVVKTEKEAWQPYALAVLNGILNGGAAARLPKDIVRGSQIASSASASYDPFERLNNQFILEGTPTAGHTITQLEAGFLAEIKRLQETLVTTEELARVKAQMVANKLYEQDSVAGQATAIGSLESIGLSWHTADEYIKNIQAITAEQIQQVTKLYLTTNNLTVATLQPLPNDKPPVNSIGDQHVR